MLTSLLQAAAAGFGFMLGLFAWFMLLCAVGLVAEKRKKREKL